MSNRVLSFDRFVPSLGFNNFASVLFISLFWYWFISKRGYSNPKHCELPNVAHHTGKAARSILITRHYGESGPKAFRSEHLTLNIWLRNRLIRKRLENRNGLETGQGMRGRVPLISLLTVHG
jgi:hypothetical protein